MNNPIQSYDDLLKRKKQLETLLDAQKELIKADIHDLKESLAPVRLAATRIANLFTKDHSAGLLGFGANRVLDLLVKKVILARSSWLTKLIIPFFVKNFSSHFIAENKDKWMNKIKHWFSSNGHDKEATEKQSKHN